VCGQGAQLNLFE